MIRAEGRRPATWPARLSHGRTPDLGTVVVQGFFFLFVRSFIYLFVCFPLTTSFTYLTERSQVVRQAGRGGGGWGGRDRLPAEQRAQCKARSQDPQPIMGPYPFTWQNAFPLLPPGLRWLGVSAESQHPGMCWPPTDSVHSQR